MITNEWKCCQNVRGGRGTLERQSKCRPGVWWIFRRVRWIQFCSFYFLFFKWHVVEKLSFCWVYVIVVSHLLILSFFLPSSFKCSIPMLTHVTHHYLWLTYSSFWLTRTSFTKVRCLVAIKSPYFSHKCPYGDNRERMCWLKGKKTTTKLRDKCKFIISHINYHSIIIYINQLLTLHYNPIKLHFRYQNISSVSQGR
jgi:hypothetical protein